MKTSKSENGLVIFMEGSRGTNFEGGVRRSRSHAAAAATAAAVAVATAAADAVATAEKMCNLRF